MSSFYKDFWQNFDSAIQSIIKTEFLNSTKGVVIFLVLSLLFIVSMLVLMVLLVKGSFKDFALHYNDFVKSDKSKRYKADYEYLVGIVYYDTNTKMTHMTTRIENSSKGIICYRQRVVNGVPIEGEMDGKIDVADVEHMLGLYTVSKDKNN